MGYFKKRAPKPFAASAPAICEPSCTGFAFLCPDLVTQLREMRCNGVRPDLDVVGTAAFDGTPVGNWDVDPAGNIKVSRMDRVAATMNSWTRVQESQPAKPSNTSTAAEPEAPASESGSAQ